MHETELGAAFADVWCAIPKVTFGRTLDSVRGNARRAEAPVTEDIPLVLIETRTFGSRVIPKRACSAKGKFAQRRWPFRA